MCMNLPGKLYIYARKHMYMYKNQDIHVHVRREFERTLKRECLKMYTIFIVHCACTVHVHVKFDIETYMYM